jgi:glycosyltransferase involved in cell wall biosynthesis
LTKNEEQFIKRCIQSVLWADEVLILDSGSTDRTKKIAASLGATVYDQEWLGYAVQRNKALSLATYDWVFFLDADEIVTSELEISIKQVLNSTMDRRDGYSIDRRGDFLGILLPNISRPSKRNNFVRLFNKSCSSYDPTMKVHEEVRFPGKAIPLEGLLIHWGGNVMNEYITALNRYSILEAEVLNEKGYRANGLIVFLRPILRFLWIYIARYNFLLGTRGLIHAMLGATREYVRYAKLWEMQNITSVLHPAKNIYSFSPTEETANQN